MSSNQASEEFKGEKTVFTQHAQRRRRVERLAQRVSAGKAGKKKASPGGAAQSVEVLFI